MAPTRQRRSNTENKWKDRAKEFKSLWLDSKKEAEHWNEAYRRKCWECEDLRATNNTLIAACEQAEGILSEAIDMMIG